MIIKKATPEDAPDIAELEQLCFSSPWSLKSISDTLGVACNSMFLAVENGEKVGYIGLTVAADEGYILNVAVNPGFRRRGIGRALVAHVIDEFSPKLSFLTLEVRPSNTAAVELYSSLGFERVGERKNYYRNPTENALLLTKYFT